LYLAGTFEDRLLLRLIGKYEKARACLSVMPNTLSVTADPPSLHEPLFAEDLFSELPRLIHSLDLTAEDNDSEAYRDLLREIDRAFQSFDHMAVRHGWLSGGETDRLPADETMPVDLPAFVASVLPPDGRVPTAWHHDLQGLPGFDQGVVRLTHDPLRLRDNQGRTLLYPGRSHPLTRRAVTSVRTATAGRVAQARGELSLLATYAVETTIVPFRQGFALRLMPDGTIREEPDWLTVTETTPDDGIWDRLFAGWVKLDTLHQSALTTGHRLAEAFTAAHQARLDRDEIAIRAWLDRRADELCGPRRPVTGDLFAPVPALPDPATAEQRLDACGTDPAQPAAVRRDAAEALARFQSRPHPKPSPPSIRNLGLLMLVP
jgi:hypothetical protein